MTKMKGSFHGSYGPLQCSVIMLQPKYLSRQVAARAKSDLYLEGELIIAPLD